MSQDIELEFWVVEKAKIESTKNFVDVAQHSMLVLLKFQENLDKNSGKTGGEGSKKKCEN